MQSATINDELTRHYSAGIDALGEIIHTYFFLGRLADALHLLQMSRPMLEANEVAPRDCLKLLLLYGRVLIVDHLLHRGDTELLFATLEQARQIAETTQNQQGLAEALNLLGQAHCNTTTVATVQGGALPFGTQEQGKYAEAMAYQQQALKLQEALHDTQGMSETLFGIGLIHQFWQQNNQARAHFQQAIQVAAQHGHLLEQAEPHRHLAIDALFQQDLDLALTHARQALAFREAGAFKPYQPLDHISLQDIYLKKEDAEKAAFHLQQATSLAASMGLSEVVSSMIKTISRLGEQA